MNQKVILCLDGGGMKGISLVMILMEIFKRLEIVTGRHLEPCQVFNVFGGTSTGGLLSTFIGLKRHELSKSLYLYMSSDPGFLRPKTGLGILKDLSKYDSEIAINTYKNFFGKDHIDQYKADNNVPYVIATALRIDKVPTETYIFKNFESYGKVPDKVKSITNFMVYEMARSTSAAPTFWNAYTRDIDTIYKLFKKAYGTNTMNLTSDDITTHKFVNLISKYVGKYSGIDKIKQDYDIITANNMRNKFRYACENAMVLVDGGMGSNNPVLLAVSEMVNLTESSSIDDISFVLSIGCGTIETTDSHHYSSIRKINQNAESNNLTVDLLEIFTSTLYKLYKKINVLLKSLKYQFTKNSANKNFTDILDSNEYNFNFDYRDLEKINENNVMLSKTEFITKIVDMIISTPVAIVNNIASMLLDFCFKTVGIDKLFPDTITYVGIDLINGMINIYNLVAYYFSAFKLICRLFVNNISQAYAILKNNIKTVNDANLYAIYDNIIVNFKKILYNPARKHMINTVIISIFKQNGANVLVNIKNELLNFLNENVLETLTGGTYDSNICSNLLKDKYIRLSPIYDNRVDLAESNPVNLRKMMMYTKKYIENNSTVINEVVNKLSKIIMSDGKISETIIRNNVKPFSNFDSSVAYGYNIRNNIKYMKTSIYNMLDVTVSDIPTYLSKKILSIGITLFYTIYYEAYYCFLDALINYTNNNILSNDPSTTKIYEFKYKNHGSDIIKKFTYDEIIDILKGNIDISKYYNLDNIQLGGANQNIFTDALEYDKTYRKTLRDVYKITQDYKSDEDDEHVLILYKIINFALKMDDTNNLCYGCKSKNNILYCKTLNNVENKSES